jgi:hypothetical protein
MRTSLIASLLIAVLAAAPAFSQTFSPDSMDREAAAPPLQVMILGTPHLSGAPDGFRADMLEPVLDRLSAFQPTHVAVETPSAEHLRFLQSESDRLPGVADQFGGAAIALSETAAAVTGADPYEAAARLDGEGETLDRTTRMILAARAGEAPRAVALWLSHDAAGREAFAAQAPALAEALTGLSQRRDETYLIGAHLAARFNPDTISGMDDWSSGDTFFAAIPRLQAMIEDDPVLSQAGADPALAALGEASRSMVSAEATLEAYRFFNADDAQTERAQAEWAPFLAAPSDPEAARVRLAVWEARNLRMAANILELSQGRPGGRVLVVVGASHKPYLEAMLEQLGAINIVSAERVLSGQ